MPRRGGGGTVFGVLIVGAIILLLFLTSPGQELLTQTRNIVTENTIIQQIFSPSSAEEEGASVYMSLPHSVGNGWTKLGWDVVTFDNGDLVNLTANNQTIVVQEGGLYQVRIMVNHWGNPTGSRGVALYVNGSFTAVEWRAPIGSQETPVSLDRVVSLKPTSVVHVETFQSTGGPAKLNVGSARSVFEVIKV